MDVSCKAQKVKHGASVSGRKKKVTFEKLPPLPSVPHVGPLDWDMDPVAKARDDKLIEWFRRNPLRPQKSDDAREGASRGLVGRPARAQPLG